MADSRLVSYVPAKDGCESLLVVGIKEKGKNVEPSVVYQGKEADDIWKKLEVDLRDDQA